MRLSVAEDAPRETYLLLPLSAALLCRDQRLVVGAALGCEVDFRQCVFHQRHRQVDAVNVQPADEVPSFVHALHLHLHLGQEQRTSVLRRRGARARHVGTAAQKHNVCRQYFTPLKHKAPKSHEIRPFRSCKSLFAASGS